MAKRIVRTTTEESAEKFPSCLKSEKNPAAVALGRLAGLLDGAEPELKSHSLKGLKRLRIKPLRRDGSKVIYIKFFYPISSNFPLNYLTNTLIHAEYYRLSAGGKYING
jgi:hypothetical protein